MTWGEFKKLVDRQGFSDSDKIDYIDIDICYTANPEILVEQGREKNSKKITRGKDVDDIIYPFLWMFF
jgi:hypothetical protein